ncbi:glycosyltransferase family 4 protein [Pontibacter sp. SGAir0037]|uniref:glycosyltransferase family 4 protein n=1 Tax=Pontibacter sp. SGAir0037 TaxID=2571030 RepID=UPI0010CD1807|nr:glycosyltransferase family 4 protein [Pontibacter sp. SGAir0037]QCR24350.1 glycosyltransferase WbuB [Pontibacter sp. SGAir0037]
MHIAVFNQHHHSPDCPATCRHYTFLEYLAQRHSISLVTSSAWKQVRITDKHSWVPAGVQLYEQYVPYQNQMGVAQRLFSYGGFAAYSMAKGLRMPEPNVIWAVSTPLSTPWVAAKVARLRGLPWVFEVQDLWPAFPIQMGAVKSKWMQQRLYKLEKELYQSASHIITLSPDMTDYIAGLGIPAAKITTNYNGTDLELSAAIGEAEIYGLREQYQLQGKQVVLYAGTYGRANDIPTLMQAVEYLKSEPAVQFVFAGNGYYEPQLQALAKQCQNLLLLPPQPREKIFKLFKLADVSLVTFNDLPVLATNSPAKFYDSLACGTPVIVTNPGWTKSFVEKYNVGWYTPPEQAQLLAQTIKAALAAPGSLKEKGANGIAVAKTLFDRQILAKQVEQVLEQVV